MPKIPYLRNEKIEAASLCLLAEYGRKYREIVSAPVPVEEILEAHLGLALEFDDLPRRLRVSDALGATWFKARRVVIEESLDPTGDATKEGRYRFTLAHEIGHWELHRRFFLDDPSQTTLFEEDGKPAIVCRTGSRKDPMEWQADTFSGYLLMPSGMVRRAWEAHTGGPTPYLAEEEMKNLTAKWGQGADSQPTVEIAKVLARDFRVSGQAMQIRLIGLGLIRTERPEPDLFNV